LDHFKGAGSPSNTIVASLWSGFLEIDRTLAIQAAEAGVSLNRMASAKLSR